MTAGLSIGFIETEPNSRSMIIFHLELAVILERLEPACGLDLQQLNNLTKR
jgi:hypothetical protein